MWLTNILETHAATSNERCLSEKTASTEAVFSNPSYPVVSPGVAFPLALPFGDFARPVEAVSQLGDDEAARVEPDARHDEEDLREDGHERRTVSKEVQQRCRGRRDGAQQQRQDDAAQDAVGVLVHERGDRRALERPILIKGIEKEHEPRLLSARSSEKSLGRRESAPAICQLLT